MSLRNLNYIYFDTIDIFGNKILSTYSLEQTPLTFIPDLTTSVVLSATSASNTFIIDTNYYSRVKAMWDYGDGSVSYGLTGNHYWRWPGSYKVKLIVFDEYGNSYENSYYSTINVLDFISPTLTAETNYNFNKNTVAGRLTDRIGLKMIDSWQNFQNLSATGYTINLYASGSNSYYYSIKNYLKDKYAHLKRFYKFSEKKVINGVLQDVINDKINLKLNKIHAKIVGNTIKQCSDTDANSFLVGASGITDIYFTDDSTKNRLSNSDPIFVFANIDASNFHDYYTFYYSNLSSNTTIPYLNYEPLILPNIKSRFNPASRLSITTNGLDGEGPTWLSTFNINENNFLGCKIPFVVKLKDSENYSTKNYGYLSCNNNLPYSSINNLKIHLINKDTNTIVQSVSFGDGNLFNEVLESGGFYKGYLVPLSTCENVQLTAGILLNDIPNFQQDTPYTYIFHPYFEYAIQMFDKQEFSACRGIIEKEEINQYNFIFTEGTRALFCASQVVSSNNYENDFSVWLSDPDNEIIRKYDNKGNIIFDVNLRLAGHSNGIFTSMLDSELSSSSPSWQALDHNNNLFVTLFDSGSVIKINGNTGLIDKVIYPNIFYTNYLTTSADYYTHYGFAGEKMVLPSCVDIDKEGNAYVVYCHPLSNFVVKYNNNGELIKYISFLPTDFNLDTTGAVSPERIIIDRNNIIWVTVNNNNYFSTDINDENNFVVKLDTNLNMLDIFTGFGMIGDVCIDGSQNLWVSNGQNAITKIEYNESSYNPISQDINFSSKYDIFKTYIQDIEGIAINSKNELLILHNTSQIIYYIDLNNFPEFYTKELLSPSNNFYEYSLDKFYDARYQATGDWTGANWINKFYYKNTTNFKFITGSSNIFNVFPTSGYQILYRKNENFDANKFYKELALQDSLQDKTNLFDNFIGQIAGKNTTLPNEGIYKHFYERVANFKDNIANVDKCTIDSLVNKCTMYNVPYDNYLYTYPPSLKRLIDVFSMDTNHIHGTEDISDREFKNYKNIGNEINLDTGTFQGNEYIVAWDKISNKYKIANFSIIDGFSANSTINLSDYSPKWGWSLNVSNTISGSKIGEFYKFYRYIKNDNEFIDSVIDWNDNFNTISKNLSTDNEYFKDGGVADKNFTYIVSKGLNLFDTSKLS